MPSHSDSGSGHGSGHEPEKIDASLGYESRDVNIRGIIVFIVSMMVFVVVVAVVSYGVGKVLNAHLNKEDGPTSKWSKTVDIRQLGNMPSSAAMQDKVANLMQQFPTPRLEVSDGEEAVADLHAREDLLLDHYTWINQSKGTVRIPIERAMEVLAQQGLPVAPPVKGAQLMTGDSRPVVSMPLTDGFAPTTYEQERAATREMREEQREVASK